MERKLERKDIAGYLPYIPSVRVLNTKDTKNGGKIKRLLGCNFYSNTFWIEDEHALKEKDFKIVLHPPSDLYRTITNNGKEIVPIDVVLESGLQGYDLYDFYNSLKIDYRNLIEKNLAISVYDLQENPYK